VSYCQVLKQNNKNKDKSQRVVVFQNDSAVLVKKPTKTTGFAALALLDEEADLIEAHENQAQAEYPVLRQTKAQAPALVKVTAPAMSYASMANKAAVSDNKHKTPPAVTKSRAIVTHNLVKKSWADWSDSDDDDASDCECGHCDF